MAGANINRWWTVVAGTFGTAISAATIVNFAFSVFIKPVTAEYGWSRGVMSYSHAIFVISSGVGHLLLGSLMLRFGPRAPTIAFLVVFGLAVGCVSLLPPSVPLFYMVFLIAGFAGAAAGEMPYAAVIANQFDRERGFAFGLTAAGAGLGSPILAFYSTYLLTHFGWRTGYIGLGLLVVIPILGLLFLVRMPQAQMVAPAYADAPATTEDEQPAPSFAKIFVNRTFLLISLPMAVLFLAIGIVLSNLIPILTDSGLSLARAAQMASIFGFSSIASRIAVGYLLDRLFMPYVATGIFVILLAALALLGFGLPNINAAYLGVAFIGCTVYAFPNLLTMAISRYFPPSWYSKLLGAGWMLGNWASGLAMVIVGYTFSQFGSYHVAMAICAGAVFLSIVAVLRLGPYPYPPMRRLPPRFVLRPKPTE